MATKKKSTESASAPIVLTRLESSTILVPIIGVTPVIPHNWSEKAKRMMPGHPDKPKTKEVKGTRDPLTEAEGCLYVLEDGQLGLPAVAFKAAAVGACRFFSELTIVETKQLLFVEGLGKDNLVPITGEKRLREDLPRNSNGSTDIRYRYEIFDWKAVLSVNYVPARISKDSIISLIDAAGRGGVGDWRPSAPKATTGIFGQFKIDDGELSA